MLPEKCCGPSQCLGQPIAMETYIKDGQTDLPNHRPIEIKCHTKIIALNIKIYYVHTLNQKHRNTLSTKSAWHLRWDHTLTAVCLDMSHMIKYKTDSTNTVQCKM